MAYLDPVVTRHILAFLALLSGLVTLSGPANASLAEALACDASIAALAGDEASGHEGAVNRPAPVSPRATRALEAPVPRPAVPEAPRLPVLMGIERAHT